VLGIALLAFATVCDPAYAASLSQNDVMILTKSMGLLKPPPIDASNTAIAHEPSDPISIQKPVVLFSKPG
jgi:hypothetical protein